MHVTITLDSGAFLQDLQPDESYKEIEVGYFGTGPLVPDLHVLADGEYVEPKDPNLDSGKIEIILSSASRQNEIHVTEALARTLLRLSDLYPMNTPSFDREQFECILVFTSGRFCCSMVKTRSFKEHSVVTGMSTGSSVTPMKLISHNVGIQYELDDGDKLEIKRNGTDTLFTTVGLKPGTKRVDIEVMAHNNTATRFFRDALTLNGSTFLLPNQGDPPPTSGSGGN